ncbi:hypothetical protein LJB42_001243 [Komagataella kurtzmanii]|nr:hypothetical protein LJB42_001243 [Komagataella kurtzmanii]
MFARKYSVFQIGDIAILRQVTRPDKVWLSKPLKPGNFQGVKSGSISHDDIIGTRSRCKVFETSKGQFKFMCYKPSLEEYVNLTKRDAQPIYPFNAATIVQLADLNVDYPELERKQNGEYCLKDEPLQFLECGTGHGSLTLAIAKAIHSGNCYKNLNGLGSSRLLGAVLHSIDKNPNHLATGQKNLKNYQRAMYEDDVQFCLADSPIHWLQSPSTKEWIKNSSKNNDPVYDHSSSFLSGIFLDMPDPEAQFKDLSIHLKVDHALIIFCPSVTQILNAVQTVHHDRSIKLAFSRCIEFEPCTSGGSLREWDVRVSDIRNTNKEGVVCRPRVGTKISGGGFVGVFKKLPLTARSEPTETPLNQPVNL